jgi:hypothetical protein
MHKFKVVCATQLELPSGMQLWGVSQDARLLTTLQKRPNAPWEAWSECALWSAAPTPRTAPWDISALAAAPNPDGYMSLWALTADHVLHCQSQLPNGQRGWSDRDYPKGWWNAPKLTCMCAGVMGWSMRGRCFWGVGEDGQLWVTYEDLATGPLGRWVKFYNWDKPPPGGRIIALTTAVAGNRAMSLWALTDDHVLHCKSQRTADDSWPDPWVAGWWNAPKLVGICASMQGGSLGRAIWGIGEDGKLYWTYEKAAMGGGWTDWQQFPGPGNTVSSLSAARQSDGRVVLWALSEDNVLYNNIQKTAGGEWAGWELGGTRHENLGFIDEIERTLARKPDKNEGVTYRRTSGNKFTLLATPGLWGQEPTATGRGSDDCNKLLNEITNVIGSATQILDLTFLYNPHPSFAISAFPDGGFQEAISKGFETLITSGRTSGRWPSIRILFGVPLGGFWRYNRFPALTPKGRPRHIDLMESEKRWLKETIELTKRYKMVDVKCPIQLAHGKSQSWNHTKIIVADDKIAITGGHNFWDGDYLGAAPVHDVSGVFEGPAARAARLFCDKLWTQTAGSFSLIDGVLKDRAAPPTRQMPILNTGTPGERKMKAIKAFGAVVMISLAASCVLAGANAFSSRQVPCIAKTPHHRCRRWVKTGRLRLSNCFPLCPRKQTSRQQDGMSQMGHLRKYRPFTFPSPWLGTRRNE